MSEPTGWRLIWADYNGRRIGMGDKPPAPARMDFPTKEAALAAKANLVGGEIVASVVPLFIKARGNRKPHEAFGDLPKMTKRLTA